MSLYRLGIATFFYQNGIAGVSCPLLFMGWVVNRVGASRLNLLTDNLFLFPCQQNCGTVNSDDTLLVALPTA